MPEIRLAYPQVEEALLACCLESTASLIGAVGSGLKPEDFGSPTHEIIFRSLRNMFDKGQQVDKHTLCSYLDGTNKLELIGGEKVIERLEEIDFNSHLSQTYVEIVKDRSIRRDLFDATEKIVKELYKEEDVRSLITSAENYIYRVSDKINGGSMKGVPAADLVELYRTRSGVTEKIPYHYETLNRRLGGRERGALSIWGGYTSDGKTIQGQQSAIHAAANGYNVGYFTLEMTEEEMLFRMLSSMTGVNYKKIQESNLNIEEAEKLEDAAFKISKLPITTYHDPSYTPEEIKSIQMRERYDLIVVDYLQRFDFTDYAQIPRIAKKFKNIALSTKCCIDLLSQLTPPAIKPGDNPFPRPSNNNLYGGKATAHEANNIFFIWAHRFFSEGGWNRTGTGEVIVSKARGGTGEFSFGVEFDSSRVVWEEPIEAVRKLRKVD